MDPCVGIPGMTGSYRKNWECVGKGAPDGGMRLASHHFCTKRWLQITV